MSVATIFKTVYVAVFSFGWFPLLISRYFALCIFSKPTFRGHSSISESIFGTKGHCELILSCGRCADDLHAIRPKYLSGNE